MSKEEYKEFIKVLKARKHQLSKSTEESKKFLVDLGVVTKKGNLKKNYKNLCIPIEQD